MATTACARAVAVPQRFFATLYRESDRDESRRDPVATQETSVPRTEVADVAGGADLETLDGVVRRVRAMVAVTGSVDDVDLRLFTRMLHHSTSGMAVALDVGAWLGEGSRGAATGALSSHGWRTVTLGTRHRLDAVWQDLGHTSAQAARSGGVVSEVGR